jgi:hypothetical protein
MKSLLFWSVVSGVIDTADHVSIVQSSFAELHHFYAAPVPGENFDVAPAPAAQSPGPKVMSQKKAQTE